MSDQISDDAWYMAGLKKLKRENIFKIGPSGSKAWVTFSCEDNDHEDITPEVTHEEALAAQAELDARREVTDEMVEAGARASYEDLKRWSDDDRAMRGASGDDLCEWPGLSSTVRAKYRNDARIILEAAFKEMS